MRYSVLVIIGFVLFGFSACQPKTACEAPFQQGLLTNKIKGMSLTAPRDPFVVDPMQEMAAVGIQWSALLPYAFFDSNTGDIIWDTVGNFQWWGETTPGIVTSHNLAKAQGMKTMLKPQLWAHNIWIGDLEFQTQAEWDYFHSKYTDFICYWAKLADSLNVDMFCIGTEIKRSAMNHPTYWRGLIDSIRQVYSGPLTYASNWDEYQGVTFWDKLDYIGTDAYFSLLPDQTPSVCDLKTAWEPIVNDLKSYSETWNKPILFTEWGYLTLDGCAYKTWELEKDRSSANINQQAQANAVQALLETFGKESWWAGGFQWKWYSDLATSTRDRSDDYTPQGKQAEDVLKVMYE